MPCLCSRFYIKLKNVGAEIYGMVKTAFQEEALSYEKFIDWFHCYKMGAHPLKVTGILGILHQVEMMK